ncbi:hypothetical protein [Vagococcus fluvialis]|uniref:Uncharacterized protein n=1 Tax=Vagococcus fluvialis TaxID=2738 RepID=A0A7X6DAV1_9ENTE|nr:hypothetical protein [Vagococcus fluvialis]NKC68975.1 hypothetical protein [Vagococcus fluvialis]
MDMNSGEAWQILKKLEKHADANAPLPIYMEAIYGAPEEITKADKKEESEEDDFMTTFKKVLQEQMQPINDRLTELENQKAQQDEQIEKRFGNTVTTIQKNDVPSYLDAIYPNY